MVFLCKYSVGDVVVAVGSKMADLSQVKSKGQKTMDERRLLHKHINLT